MKSLLIDTNLLVLFLVGQTNKNYISDHKSTKIFTLEEFDGLCRCIAGFQTLWVTSHCLAEVSNHLEKSDRDSRHGRRSEELLHQLKKFIQNSKETFIEKEELIKQDYFIRLGIADTGFILQAAEVDFAITTDSKMYDEASKLYNSKGEKIINWNHYKEKLYELESL